MLLHTFASGHGGGTAAAMRGPRVCHKQGRGERLSTRHNSCPLSVKWEGGSIGPTCLAGRFLLHGGGNSEKGEGNIKD